MDLKDIAGQRDYEYENARVYQQLEGQEKTSKRIARHCNSRRSFNLDPCHLLHQFLSQNSISVLLY